MRAGALVKLPSRASSPLPEPITDAMFRLVFRMHSRLHAEIVLRRIRSLGPSGCRIHAPTPRQQEAQTGSGQDGIDFLVMGFLDGDG